MNEFSPCLSLDVMSDLFFGVDFMAPEHTFPRTAACNNEQFINS